MATFTIIQCFLVLAHPCMGASLTAQVRREPAEPSSVEVNAQAQLMRHGLGGSGADETSNDTTGFATVGTNYSEVAIARNLLHYCPKPEGNFCGCDYPEGIANTKITCVKSDVQELNTDPGMCGHAAWRAGVSTESDHFLVTDSTHPMGCFKTACVNNPSKTCYRYNLEGDISMLDDTVSGTPICARDRYLNGTAHTGTHATVTTDTSGGGGLISVVQGRTGGCPDGYKVIMKEDRCLKAAGCLPYCKGSDYFSVGAKNSSRHLDYPTGCFINTKGSNQQRPEIMEAGCIYFNAPSGMGEPTNPHGTVLCMVDDETQ